MSETASERRSEIVQVEPEVVDAVPVPAPQPGGELVEHRSYGLIAGAAPAAHAVAMAAGGFIAGAAVVGLAGRRRSKRARIPAKRKRARGDSAVGELVRIVGTRSLLVDVHLLDRAR